MSREINEIVDEIAQHPTLDRFLDRHPSTLKFPDDYRKLVEVLRQQRALFIKAEAERKEKRKAE